MPPPGSYRNVRFETTWEADLERLRNGDDPPALVDEVVGEIDWVLSRLADSYKPVDGTQFRFLNIPGVRGLSSLTAWFVIESDECVVCYKLEEVLYSAEEDDTDGLSEEGDQ